MDCTLALVDGRPRRLLAISGNCESLAANRSRAVCPNCGQTGIDVAEVPRNHGDQLLVNKQAFLYQSPRRWDVVVFRNPAHPTEAYVKRAVGLPGERIQIVGGDIVVDGQIARKSYRQQLVAAVYHERMGMVTKRAQGVGSRPA